MGLFRKMYATLQVYSAQYQLMPARQDGMVLSYVKITDDSEPGQDSQITMLAGSDKSCQYQVKPDNDMSPITHPVIFGLGRHSQDCAVGRRQIWPFLPGGERVRASQLFLITGLLANKTHLFTKLSVRHLSELSAARLIIVKMLPSSARNHSAGTAQHLNATKSAVQKSHSM